MQLPLWRNLLSPYELAVQELVAKFNHIITEHKQHDLYPPIEFVSGRVKRISSILEKMQRKNISFPRMEEEIEDIAGIRIICQFEEDIAVVAGIIAKRSDMEIKSEKDYLKNTKDSGYRSYHLIIYYVVETLEGPKKLQVELQIRTLAMNFWATIEHSLQYKYKGSMPQKVSERLSKVSEAIMSLDKEMSEARNDIMDAQYSRYEKSAVVANILCSIENLFYVANKREVIKIQDEFLEIYDSGDFKRLQRFDQQLDLIAEGYRAQDLAMERHEE
ncbi:MAG: GTP pyrophosphokinase family protein [Lachnospiraceae bacterium]